MRLCPSYRLIFIVVLIIQPSDSSSSTCMWLNDTPRSSSIASDLNTLSNRGYMYPSPSPQPMHRQFNQSQQQLFNNQFSQPQQQQMSQQGHQMMQQRTMDPRLRTMSSSVFDLNQGNTMMRQPMMSNNNPQWMNNNMQQVRE